MSDEAVVRCCLLDVIGQVVKAAARERAEARAKRKAAAQEDEVRRVLARLVRRLLLGL